MMTKKFLIRVRYSDIAERPDEHHYVRTNIYSPVAKSKVRESGLSEDMFYDSLSEANEDMRSMVIDEYSKAWLKEIAVVQVPKDMPLVEYAVESYQEI